MINKYVLFPTSYKGLGLAFISFLSCWKMNIGKCFQHMLGTVYQLNYCSSLLLINTIYITNMFMDNYPGPLVTNQLVLKLQ